MSERDHSPVPHHGERPFGSKPLRYRLLAMALVMGLSVMFLNILEKAKEVLPGGQSKGSIGGLVIVTRPPPPPPLPPGPGTLVSPPAEPDVIKPGPDPEEPPG